MTAANLLAFVFECAIEDRAALVDAYRGEGEWAQAAREDIARFKALRSKLITAKRRDSSPEAIARLLAAAGEFTHPSELDKHNDKLCNTPHNSSPASQS